MTHHPADQAHPTQGQVRPLQRGGEGRGGEGRGGEGRGGEGRGGEGRGGEERRGEERRVGVRREEGGGELHVHVLAQMLRQEQEKGEWVIQLCGDVLYHVWRAEIWRGLNRHVWVYICRGDYRHMCTRTRENLPFFFQNLSRIFSNRILSTGMSSSAWPIRSSEPRKMHQNHRSTVR